MPRLQMLMFMLLSTIIMAACGPPKQSIPISTNPLGALVYVDGEKTCTTPCSLRLTKTSKHLLTIVKPEFEQVDITIERQFRPDKPLRDAALSAILTGKAPKEAAGKAAKEMDEQEKSGEAYELIPAIISIKLKPAHQE